MAKVRFVNDILSPNGTREFDTKNGLSIRNLIDDYSVNLAPRKNEFEVYNAETGETSYATEIVENFNAVVIVNGLEVENSYVIEENDIIEIMFVPASSEGGRQIAAGTITSAAGIGLILAGIAIIIASTITLPFSGGVSVGGIIGGAAILAAGLGTTGMGIAIAVDGAKKLNSATTSDSSTAEHESLLSIAGGSCQSIVGQRIPFVMGKHLVNPL